jgi:hypothetical protein
MSIIRGGFPFPFSHDGESVHILLPFTNREANHWKVANAFAERNAVASVHNATLEDALAEADKGVDQKIAVLCEHTRAIHYTDENGRRTHLTTPEEWGPYYDSLIAGDMSRLFDVLLNGAAARDLLFRGILIPGTPRGSEQEGPAS